MSRSAMERVHLACKVARVSLDLAAAELADFIDDEGGELDWPDVERLKGARMACNETADAIRRLLRELER